VIELDMVIEKGEHIKLHLIYPWSGNESPVLEPHSGTVAINGEEFLYVTKDVEASFVLNGTDDGTLTFGFGVNTAGATLDGAATGGLQTVKLTLNDFTPVRLR